MEIQKRLTLEGKMLLVLVCLAGLGTVKYGKTWMKEL